MPTAEKCIELYDYLKAEKGPLESYFQEINEFILPRKAQVTTRDVTPGQRHDWRRFDHVGMNSNVMLAASINGALTSAATQWFELALDDAELNKDQEAKEWLAASGRRIYAELNNSNFGNRIQQTYLDLGGYGTSALGVFERRDRFGRFDGLRFFTYPIREYVFEEGTDDRAAGFYRLLTLTVSRIASEWHKGIPGFRSYGPEINEALRRGDVKEMQQQRDILICVYQRDQYRDGSVAPEQRPIAYDVIDYKTRHKIVASGTFEMPIMVPRWEANSDDRGWGRGPGMTALPAARQRSKVRYYGQRAIAKDADPAIVVPFRGIFGQIRTGPGGIIYKRQGADMPQTLTSGARYDAVGLELDSLRKEIEEYFYIDQLRPFHQTPNMTATEAQLRYELMMRLLGPTYGRLTYELYDPMIYRVFNVLLRAGRIPQPPQVVMEAMRSEEGASMKVEYVGPLAKAQRSKDVQAIERTYALAQGITAATGRTQALDRLDDDKAMQMGADVLGAPPEIILSDDAVRALRQRRQQEEADAAARQELGETADAMKGGAAAVKDLAAARQMRGGGA